jgi:hypothetical protein
LSQKHGVNPHLTICPRCGQDGDEIVLTGSHHKYKCDSCGQLHVGRPDGGRCANANCHANTSGSRTLVDLGEMDPYERMQGTQPCRKCEEELKTFRAEIDRGGIPCRCKDCRMEGVIKAEHELAKKVRAMHDGKVAGLEFTKTDCPQCGPNKVV